MIIPRLSVLVAASLCLFGCSQSTQPGGNTNASSNSPAAAAPPAGNQGDDMTTTASGLKYQVLKHGTGTVSPKAADTVKVHYEGKLLDGTVFDSSIARGQPIEFPLSGVIPCWTEGVQKMKVGGKARLTCPPAIAYGARGAGGVIPPNATLNFEVELLGIK